MDRAGGRAAREGALAPAATPALVPLAVAASFDDGGATTTEGGDDERLVDEGDVMGGDCLKNGLRCKRNQLRLHGAS